MEFSRPPSPPATLSAPTPNPSSETQLNAQAEAPIETTTPCPTPVLGSQCPPIASPLSMPLHTPRPVSEESIRQPVRSVGQHPSPLSGQEQPPGSPSHQPVRRVVERPPEKSPHSRLKEYAPRQAAQQPQQSSAENLPPPPVPESQESPKLIVNDSVWSPSPQQHQGSTLESKLVEIGPKSLGSQQPPCSSPPKDNCPTLGPELGASPWPKSSTDSVSPHQGRFQSSNPKLEQSLTGFGALVVQSKRAVTPPWRSRSRSFRKSNHSSISGQSPAGKIELPRRRLSPPQEPRPVPPATFPAVTGVAGLPRRPSSSPPRPFESSPVRSYRRAPRHAQPFIQNRRQVSPSYSALQQTRPMPVPGLHPTWDHIAAPSHVPSVPAFTPMMVTTGGVQNTSLPPELPRGITSEAEIQQSLRRAEAASAIQSHAQHHSFPNFHGRPRFDRAAQAHRSGSVARQQAAPQYRRQAAGGMPLTHRGVSVLQHYAFANSPQTVSSGSPPSVPQAQHQNIYHQDPYHQGQYHPGTYLQGTHPQGAHNQVAPYQGVHRQGGYPGGYNQSIRPQRQ
ncbi:hypothetical protein B0T26DRAFT_220783 [Lasiosphaeria miniovina]|uniref:Uncharacterized protein n=1 Tax=Lasiosphaeria miniovina TaxID=1954250 RepID=A0AA40AV20_9PEZI|nr:uncharacterized protein B0T26DRAFT_220783 [Lasiosphaeria miniovina]KAK0722474.1 hypothetical protein B0T26DRAFT_220783 [Lasiosphaeria miniovina]